MNRKIILLFVSLCLAVTLTGCGGGSHLEQSKSAQESEAQENKDPSLGDVVEYFKEQGLQVGEVKTKASCGVLLGEVDSFSIDVEGERIELHLIDPEKKEEELKNIDLEKVIDESKLRGFSVPSGYLVSYGNIVLVGIDEHPDKDKISTLVKEFNKKE